MKRGILSTQFEFVKQYPVAIGFYDGPGGEPDYPTPPGFYVAEKKGKNVDWQMPYSDWIAPEDQGEIIPGGDPRNPIVARWIEIHDGIGIHGTYDVESIGKPASHGCIRMTVDHVIDLYDRVPRGTVVYIGEMG